MWNENQKYQDAVTALLICPLCQGDLSVELSTFICGECGERYSCSETGKPDFRLQRTKTYGMNVIVGRHSESSDLDLSPLELNDRPMIDYRGTKVPLHLTTELMSYFPRAKGADSLVLDLGCGNQAHKPVCEQAGFWYVGVDALDTAATILGDAHALPFADNSFEFVLSVSTFEHLKMPYVAVQEMARVLKKGGKLIGTAAFMEPFHANSFHHMSHMGLISLLEHGGFKIDRIAPNRKWSVLFSQARMALFPRMPTMIAKAIVLPVYLLHRTWWAIGRVFNIGPGEQYRILCMTGSITFIATKP